MMLAHRRLAKTHAMPINGSIIWEYLPSLTSPANSLREDGLHHACRSGPRVKAGSAVALLCLSRRALLSVAATGIAWTFGVDSAAAEDGCCEECSNELLHEHGLSIGEFEHNSRTLARRPRVTMPPSWRPSVARA